MKNKKGNRKVAKRGWDSYQRIDWAGSGAEEREQGSADGAQCGSGYSGEVVTCSMPPGIETGGGVRMVFDDVDGRDSCTYQLDVIIHYRSPHPVEKRIRIPESMGLRPELFVYFRSIAFGIVLTAESGTLTSDHIKKHGKFR